MTIEVNGVDREIEVGFRPKDSRGLWLWVEMTSGLEFEAVYPGLDILDLKWPLEVKLLRLSGTGIRPIGILQKRDTKSITVIGAIGARNLLTASG